MVTQLWGRCAKSVAVDVLNCSSVMAYVMYACDPRLFPADGVGHDVRNRSLRNRICTKAIEADRNGPRERGR